MFNVVSRPATTARVCALSYFLRIPSFALLCNSYFLCNLLRYNRRGVAQLLHFMRVSARVVLLPMLLLPAI